MPSAGQKITAKVSINLGPLASGRAAGAPGARGQQREGGAPSGSPAGAEPAQGLAPGPRPRARTASQRASAAPPPWGRAAG